jgi:peptide/nickel transport system substrate-binding protein
MYTFRYMADPKTGSFNAFVTTFMDLNAMKKLDGLTISLPMKVPFAALPGLFMCSGYGVIQDGTTSFAHPIGTGPFKFVSWTKGQSSLFVRNQNYWISGKPYVDELEMFSIPDTSARMNALLGGQVDAAIAVPYSQGVQYLGQGNSAPIRIMVTETPQEVYFTMGVAHKPFDDVRVRQAMRLIVNRPQMIEQVQFGLGKVGNDNFGLGYSLYDNQLPQRVQDIEQAKALLKQAGQENLTVTLSSSTTSAGQLEMATLFAQQATAAGVKVNVRNLPATTYYSTGWPNYAFGQTQWSGTTIDYFWANHILPGAYNNDTQWNDQRTIKLCQAALQEPDETKSRELWFEFQKDMYDYGAMIHWGTSPYVDGLGKRVGGAQPNPFWDLSCFGFKDYWLA